MQAARGNEMQGEVAHLGARLRLALHAGGGVDRVELGAAVHRTAVDRRERVLQLSLLECGHVLLLSLGHGRLLLLLLLVGAHLSLQREHGLELLDDLHLLSVILLGGGIRSGGLQLLEHLGGSLVGVADLLLGQAWASHRDLSVLHLALRQRALERGIDPGGVLRLRSGVDLLLSNVGEGSLCLLGGMLCLLQGSDLLLLLQSGNLLLLLLLLHGGDLLLLLLLLQEGGHGRTDLLLLAVSIGSLLSGGGIGDLLLLSHHALHQRGRADATRWHAHGALLLLLQARQAR